MSTKKAVYKRHLTVFKSIEGKEVSMDKETTEKLTDVLRQIDRPEDLQKYVDDLEENPVHGSFQEYFNSLPKVKASEKAALIRRTGIERTYGYQLLKGMRSPGRDKVLLFCLAAGLDLHETQRALRAAGEPVLYSRKRRDAVLIFAVNEKLSIADTQELLSQFDEQVLQIMKRP